MDAEMTHGSNTGLTGSVTMACRVVVVIGSSTFGKGVVQTIDPLPDGGELFLTWSRLLAPRGWPIQSLGVMPQICTSLGDDTVNRQLAALAAGTNLMDTAIRAHRAARAPLTPDQVKELVQIPK